MLCLWLPLHFLYHFALPKLWALQQPFNSPVTPALTFGTKTNTSECSNHQHARDVRVRQVRGSFDGYGFPGGTRYTVRDQRSKLFNSVNHTKPPTSP